MVGDMERGGLVGHAKDTGVILIYSGKPSKVLKRNLAVPKRSSDDISSILISFICLLFSIK